MEVKRLPRVARPVPRLVLTEDEKRLKDAFIATYKRDYSDLTPSDLIILELASQQYILALRLADSDIRNSTFTLNSRFHPLNQMRGLLADAGLNRKARIASNQPGSEDEADLKEALMAL